MQISENATNFLERNMTAGRAIPGQSLTNSPETPHRWEQPPEFSEPHKAMLQIFETITEKESLSNILLSLSKKVSVIDLSSIILYSGFIEGKWNPDLMTLLMEPTMYMIIALAEKADIPYSLEAGDNKKIEMSPENQIAELTDKISIQDVKLKSAQQASPQSVPQDVRKVIEETELSPSLLERVKEQTQSKNLLGREE